MKMMTYNSIVTISNGMAILSTFFYLCYIYNEILSNYFYSKNNLNSFDFIVVGAGTAGVIVASRLTENPMHKVLLLEAGDESNFLLDIPIITPLLQFSRYDWQYGTEPQKHACFGLINNSSNWPRGKVVGGSSRLNYALYVRGQRQDFDSWSKQGNSGWGYTEILPYLKKSENQKGQFKEDDFYHSVKGEWLVDDLPWVTPMADAILSAAVELEIEISDVNAKGNSGFMLVQANLENGKRCSSDTAFLKRAIKRENLKVLPRGRVEKVLFKDRNVASGVIYSTKGTKYVAQANKEIILSAGTIETPKILMLSGIGPKDHLNKFEIPVLQDLPVGKNLQDHILTGTDLILMNETLISLGSFASPLAALQYFFKGSGPWASVGCETIGFLHSSFVDSKTEAPDIQILTFPFGLSFDGGSHMRKVTGISDRIWAEYFQPLVGQQTASISPVVLRPKSRGEILLASTNPLDAPKINPRYLSHPDDVKVLIEGLRMVENLVKTKALSKFGAQLYKKAFPGCESYVFGSDSYWECYVRHLTLTSYHPVGTCKMGPENHQSSVVDSQLRVHGIRNLRVVDASIMPTIVSGNTNAATMMIGEKGADMIKTYWDDMEGVCEIGNKESCPDK